MIFHVMFVTTAVASVSLLLFPPRDYLLVQSAQGVRGALVASP